MGVAVGGLEPGMLVGLMVLLIESEMKSLSYFF